MTWRIRKFFRSLVRTIQYIPVVWGNEDWDWAWLFVLMEYKFLRMERAHLKDPYHGDSKYRYARQLRVCRVLLKRIRQDDYCDKAYETYHEKWDRKGPFLEWLNNMSEAQQKELRLIHLMQEQAKKRDEDLFFKTFQKFYAFWWT